MLGEKLKELRESKGLLQRQVAAELAVDTAYISKMENNDKPVSKSHLEALSRIYELPESELIPYWLGEKVLHVLENNEHGIAALNLVLENISNINE
ncbi:MAG: helix-turn-helix transcriptional regulator [Saprospiraceae bacterium]